MQRAMARQAEAEREKRAKIIHAAGEYQASKELAQAAEVMTAAPGSLQLRYLQTLKEIGAEFNSTIVFPLPIELFQGIVGARSTPNPNPDSPAVASQDAQFAEDDFASDDAGYFAVDVDTTADLTAETGDEEPDAGEAAASSNP